MRKYLGLTLLLFVSSLAISDEVDSATNAQSNASVASPYSSISNVVSNNNVMSRSTVGRASCAEPTLMLNATKTPDHGEYYQVGVAMPITSMFTSSSCQKAQKTTAQILEWEKADLLVERANKQKVFEKTLRLREAEVLEQEIAIAKLCTNDLHGTLAGDPKAPLVAFCSGFSNILKDHHKGAITDNHTYMGQVRISPNLPRHSKLPTLK